MRRKAAIPRLGVDPFLRKGLNVAVYRCEVKTISRSAGRSAVAAAAYRSGERLENEHGHFYPDQRDVHDYRRRSRSVPYTEICLPEGAPEWAKERGRLWNEAEAAEGRKNSVTAREVLLSLPHELTDLQRAELVHGFAEKLVTRYGVAVDVCIHKPDKRGDERNHHAHLMMSTRRLEPHGFTEKTRELDDQRKRGPEEVRFIREAWEHEQNKALEKAKSRERVSCKSLQAQQIEREPEPKRGPCATAFERAGRPSRLQARWQEVAARNRTRREARAHPQPQRVPTPHPHPIPPQLVPREEQAKPKPDPNRRIWAEHYRHAARELAHVKEAHGRERLALERRLTVLAPDAPERHGLSKWLAEVTGRTTREEAAAEAARRAQAARYAEEVRRLEEKQRHELEQLEAWHKTERQRIAAEIKEEELQKARGPVNTFERVKQPEREERRLDSGRPSGGRERGRDRER